MLLCAVCQDAIHAVSDLFCVDSQQALRVKSWHITHTAICSRDTTTLC